MSKETKILVMSRRIRCMIKYINKHFYGAMILEAVTMFNSKYRRLTYQESTVHIHIYYIYSTKYAGFFTNDGQSLDTWCTISTKHQ